jgi:glycosyltransferase involved in cell wall biosynthesis
MFVIVYFGKIRPYKNVDELVRQFAAMSDPDVRLLIVGEVESRIYWEKIEALANEDRRIVLLLRHVDDASLVACLDRADLVVLPFRKILNSSSALTALSFEKHVVVPAIGSMPSLQYDVGANAITLYDGDLSPDTMSRAITRVRQGEIASPILAEYEWSAIASKTAAFYHRLIES